MATSSIVNTLGAGSGIDVKSLAQSLVDAEKTPKKERIDAKIAKSEAKITGYSFLGVFSASTRLWASALTSMPEPAPRVLTMLLVAMGWVRWWGVDVEGQFLDSARWLET